VSALVLMVLVALGSGAGLGVQEAVAGSEPAEGRPSAVRAELAERLERWLASDLGPRMAGELRPLLEPRAGESPPEYLRVERGWISAKMAETFLALNPQWSGPSPARTVDLKGPTIATVVDLHRQLAASGVVLIVVPVPTRLNVEPDALAGIAFDEGRSGYAPGLTRWMLALADAGVEVLDLLPPLAEARASGTYEPGQICLEVNNHWGPDGARIAAEALAARLRSEPWCPAVEVRTHLESVRLAWTHPVQELAPGATAPELRFDRVLDPGGEPAASRDPASPVVLLGDSFTTMFEDQDADFARQLHHSLGFAADVIASPGGGARTSRAALARRTNPLAGKRAVVWMFAPWALSGSGWIPIAVRR